MLRSSNRTSLCTVTYGFFLAFPADDEDEDDCDFLSLSAFFCSDFDFPLGSTLVPSKR